MFMKVHLCWYKHDLNLEVFDFNKKYSPDLRISDNTLFFINDSESMSGGDLWYT